MKHPNLQTSLNDDNRSIYVCLYTRKSNQGALRALLSFGERLPFLLHPSISL